MIKKTGLVLEGGAMRGMYTAGVLDVMLENNVTFDGIIGVSAGALFGVNFLSKQHGRVIRYNKRFNKDRNYMGLKPLIREGNLFNTKYAYEEVPIKLDPFDNQTFKESKVPFYAVVTNVDTGEPEYMLISDVFKQMDILRASGSLPVIASCVEIDGKRYLDGGISDSIPTEWFAEQGFEKQVVVLTQDGQYTKKPVSKIVTRMMRKYPKIVDKLLIRHQEYNDRIALLRKLEKEGKVYIIRPSEPITISRVEKDENKLQHVYDLGRRDCERTIKNIKQFLCE